MTQHNSPQEMFASFFSYARSSRNEVDRLIEQLKARTGVKHPAELFGREAELTPEDLTAASTWLSDLLALREDRVHPRDWEESLGLQDWQYEEDEDEDGLTPSTAFIPPSAATDPEGPFPEQYLAGDPILEHTLGRMATFNYLMTYCFGDWDDDINLTPLSTYLNHVNRVMEGENAEPDNTFMLFLAAQSLTMTKVKVSGGYPEFSREAHMDSNSIDIEYVDDLLIIFNLKMFSPEVVKIVRRRLNTIRAKRRRQESR